MKLHWVAREEGAGLVNWQAYDPSVRVDLTSTLLYEGETALVIDPIPMPERDREALLAEMAPAQIRGVMVSSANHERDAAAWADRFGVPLAVPSVALGGIAVKVDRAFGDGSLFGILEAATLPGGAEGETAFYWPRFGGVWVVGDALIHLESTGLAILPEKYCSDQGRLRASLGRLGERPFSIVSFAHGPALTEQAEQKVMGLLHPSGNG